MNKRDRGGEKQEQVAHGQKEAHALLKTTPPWLAPRAEGSSLSQEGKKVEAYHTRTDAGQWTSWVELGKSMAKSIVSLSTMDSTPMWKRRAIVNQALKLPPWVIVRDRIAEPPMRRPRVTLLLKSMADTWCRHTGAARGWMSKAERIECFEMEAHGM